jgi:hypothetical protein
MPILPPKPHIKSALARAALDGLLAQIPAVGGPMAGIYRITFPGKSDIELAKWRHDLCTLFNALEDQVNQLSNKIPISEGAANIGYWIAEKSETGRSDFQNYEDIKKAFPEAKKLELLEAVGELELAGLVIISKAIGFPFRGLRTTYRLHEIFDPLVFEGVNPRIDAAYIANKLLETTKTVTAKEIIDQTGWSVRRINPALLIVGQFVSEGRKSTPMGQPYAIRSLFLDPSERALLRRFVQEMGS